MNAAVKDITPEGYRRDARGNLVWEKNISDVERVTDDLVREKFEEVMALREALIDFKFRLVGDIDALMKLVGEKYDAKLGGEKGGVTLAAFDGSRKIKVQVQDRVEFGPEIKAAEALVKDCIHRWAEGSHDNLRSIVEYAFRTDSEGKLRFGDVYALTRLGGIDDPDWQKAMQAIRDAIKVAGTASYVRFYEREGDSQKYRHVSLDLAGLSVMAGGGA
jgi:hypothetical protein